MKKFLIIVVSIMLLIALSLGIAGCSSKEDWERIESRGKFVLGFDASFPPMGYKEGEEYKGFDLDLASAVADELGLTLKLKPIKWSKKETELQSKKIDLIWNGFTVTEELKDKILFSNPYMKNSQVVVVLKDSEYKTLSDFKQGTKIAVQAKSSAIPAVNASPELKDFEKIQAEDYANALALELDSKKASCVVMDKVVIDYYLKTNISGAKDKYRILENITLAEEHYAIGFRKNDVEFANKVNGALLKLKENGTVARISTKWFGSDVTII